MPVTPLELHPGAGEDYLLALAGYRDRSFSTAEKFPDAFWRATHDVGAAPELWPAYFSGFRRYTLISSPSASPWYRINTSRTFVLAVAHGRRRPGYRLDRAD